MSSKLKTSNGAVEVAMYAPVEVPFHVHVVAVSFAMCLLLALFPAAALADRGGGSIRAAGREEPSRAEPSRAEPSRAEPSRSAPQPPREPARIEPAHAAPEVRGGHPESAARVEAPVRRDWDDNDLEIAHGGGFARGAPVRVMRGQRYHDLPHHVAIVFNNQHYFYDNDGNYYLQQDGDYVDVQPPVGAVVPALPPGAVSIVAGPTTYYYLDGVFYVAQNGVFAVVNPPPGIIVPDLPDGANQVVVNGNVYYQFNGFNYQPAIQDGLTVYTVTPM